MESTSGVKLRGDDKNKCFTEWYANRIFRCIFTIFTYFNINNGFQSPNFNKEFVLDIFSVKTAAILHLCYCAFVHRCLLMKRSNQPITWQQDNV